MEKLTYKEFEKKVNKMGYQTYHTDNMMQVINEDAVIAMIYAMSEFRMNTTLNAFRFIPKEDMESIGDLCWKLASTPLADREEPKRYYLKVKPRYNHLFSFGELYLNYQRQNANIFMSDSHENLYWQTQFTEEECDSLEKEYDLTILERVEVEDE